MYKNAFFIEVHVFGADSDEIDCCACVHTPRDSLLNVNAEPEALFVAHLPILALRWVTDALRRTLHFILGTGAFHQRGDQLALDCYGIYILFFLATATITR